MFRHWTSRIIAVLACAILAEARAQTSAPSAAKTTPASQMELARLVDLTAERLKIAIDYDASALKGTVTIRVGAGLTDRELWELANRALASRGFTTVRALGSAGMSVVRLGDARSIAAVLDESGPTANDVPEAWPLSEPGYVAVMVRVHHRPAKEIVDTVKLLLSKEGGSIAPLADTGLVVIADLAVRVVKARELLARLDAPSAVMVEEYETKYLAPAQLASLVGQVSARVAAVGGDPLKGEAVPAPNGNVLLIVAPPDRLPAWRELIARLDKREPVETATYSSRFFGTREVAKLVEDTINSGPAASIVDDRYRMVSDELTGSLTITATPSQHERIREVIQRLDAVSVGAHRPVRTFVIRNRPVAEVLAILEQLDDAGALETGLPEGGLASTQSRAPTPAAESLQSNSGNGPQSRSVDAGGAPPAPPVPIAGLEGEAPRSTGMGPGDRRRSGSFPLRSQPPGDGVSDDTSSSRLLNLTADPGTNSLIAIGEPRVLARLESLIATIDVRQPQVILGVTLVSLTEAQGVQLGVEIEKLTNIANTQIRLASLFGLSAGGAAGRAVGDAAGFTGTALNPGEFSMVVRALESMNHGRALSSPQVLVNNNQQAVLSSVLQQPFASTNASSTVATTSFGGTQDAGTTLTIRPQIAEGDHLVLQYSVALSSFVGTSGSAALPPPRQQNTVQSTVTIPDGYTVVVGGLELESESKSVTQVPLLGDVPLLGELFKNRDTSRSKTRFFVFIRAGVMRSRSFEDLKYLSDAASRSMGVEDGFPEVEPRVIR